MIKVVNGVIVDFGEDRELVIPKEAKSFDERCYEDFQLHGFIESIAVEGGNENFFADGNCLYEKVDRNGATVLVLGCKNSVINQNSAVAIGRLAFHGVDIESVSIPEGVVTIGSNAFSDSKLAEIKLNDDLLSIEQNAFMFTKLKSVFIPSEVIDIGFGVFAGCNELSNIKVDGNNTVWYSENNCLINRKTKELVACVKNSVIPEGAIEINALTFYGMEKDSVITFPESVRAIKKSSLDIPSYIEFPITVKAPKGSYAIDFAKKNRIEYIEI